MTTLRHHTNNKPIFKAPVCIDDYGSMVFVCQYTKATVSADKAIFLGAIMPNLNGTYVCAVDAVPAFKKSRECFNESEANCNTCKSLQRVPHEKNASGFLYGKCGKGITEHQYPMKENVIMFHPDDPMNMPCWGAR